MHTLVNYFKACTHNHHSGQEIQLYQLPQKYLHIPCPTFPSVPPKVSATSTFIVITSLHLCMALSSTWPTVCSSCPCLKNLMCVFKSLWIYRFLNIFPHLKNIIFLVNGCWIIRVSNSYDIKKFAHPWCTSTCSFTFYFLHLVVHSCPDLESAISSLSFRALIQALEMIMHWNSHWF